MRAIYRHHIPGRFVIAIYQAQWSLAALLFTSQVIKISETGHEACF